MPGQNAPSPQIHNIFYADDHQLIRQAISAQVNSFEQFKVSQQFANGQQLIDKIKDGGKPAIILLDLDMPVLNGYDTAKWIKENHPDIKVVILTMFDNKAAAAIAFNCGVDLFVTKCTDMHGLEKLLIELISTEHRDGHYHQTYFNERELIFLKLVCTEKRYEDIAAEMNLSLRVVEHIREYLFNKLAVHTRTGVALYAVKNGLVLLEE